MILPKYRDGKKFAMKFRTYALAGAAVAVLAIAAVFVVRQAGHKGLMSELNQPWPAKVETNQPQFPPTLTPEQEVKTFRMAPGFQVQLVASDPLVIDRSWPSMTATAGSGWWR